MDNVVFSATTRNGKYYFEVEDDGGKVDRYTIRQDGSTNYADTPNQILGELVMQSEWKEGNFEKILIDELGIGKEYLQIVKMIRAKYNWLEKLPKGSDGRVFYFEIGRYFRNGLYKNVPSDKIFKMIDDYIATSNFREDVKSENKTLKEFVEIDAKIQVRDSDGKLTRQYNNAIKKMINITSDIDLEQFDFDEVATGNCKELDNLVIKLCNQSGLNSKDIYSMLWDRFQDEYGVDFEFDIYDIFESTKSEKKTLKESDFKSEIVSFLDINNIKYTKIKIAKHGEEVWIYGNGGQIVITEWEWNRNDHDKDYADMIAYAVMNDNEIDTFYESTKSEKKTLKESSKSESIVAKLDKQFDDINISVGIINDLAEEDSITLTIKSYDDSKEILNYVRKELRGYEDVEIDYDSRVCVVIVFFYNVSSYSDRELIQTIEDIVWNVNAKFNIKEV